MLVHKKFTFRKRFMEEKKSFDPKGHRQHNFKNVKKAERLALGRLSPRKAEHKKTENERM
jgi:hypothetical protein